MAPTIVYEPPDGPPLAGEAAAAGWRPALALGAAGSRRIVSAILHAITGIVDRGFSLREAVGHARLHVTLKGEPQIERAAASPELLARLARRFGEPRIRGGRSFYMGAVQALRIDSDRRFEGMADPRRDGSAAVL